MSNIHPTLTKKFVSPFLNRPLDPNSPRPGPSTSTSASSYSTPIITKKRKIKDYVSDSGDEEEEHVSSGRPPSTQTEYHDPVARVVATAGPLGRGSPYNRPTSAPINSMGNGLIPRDGTIRGSQSSTKENLPETYWMVQWRKPQQKKHKTWDGDAVLIVRGSRCFMKDTDGKDIASAAFTGGELHSGDELRVGGKEIEIDCEIPAQQYLDGSCFGNNPISTATPSAVVSRPVSLKSSQFQSHASTSSSSPYPRDQSTASASMAGRKPVAAGNFYAKSGAEKVSLGVGNQGTKRGSIEPRYNPQAEGAVVMKRPSKDHAAKHNKKNLEIVDVVVHPELAKCLRPHQVEGVKFMYECVMGMRKTEGTGCILADEMGLGKTLQAISLIFTLLHIEQNPYGGPGAGPVVGKVLVVTPVSLVQNWRKEFHKWLGKQRVGVFVGDGDKQKIRQFANSRGHQVLLIGYEKLRTVVDVIKSSVPPIGLIICDEAHRLKSKDNKTTKMFEALSTKRRILLSGTPLQNDLSEFWAMCDFACPGLLDTYSVFNKIYEKPIVKSRAPNCSDKDLELGQARADKLSEITGQFILRRTADILSHYLPPKREYILFIAPTALQLEIFAALLTPQVLQMFTRGATAQCLALINHLKKICNCPLLLKVKEDSADGVDDEMKAAMRLIPHGKSDPIPMSGKLIALDQLLTSLYRDTEEKIVLVSNYTSTLDVLEAYCSRKRYKTLRLDGSTAVKARQDLVDAFNNGSQHQSFVFLLSSKAGGVGLNLIGASRLVLFDSDWNPSTDLQAQARIHRDGQKRIVHIYRFLTTGTIEEKIYQRQITKLGLSDQLMDQAKTSKSKETDSFSPEELRDLFTVHMKTNGCQTHDLLGCDCAERQANAEDCDDPSLLELSSASGADESGDDQPKFVVASQYDGRPTKKQRIKDAEAKQAKLAALLKFTHLDPSISTAAALIQDDLLHGMLGIGKRKKGAKSSASSVSAQTSRATTEKEDSEIADSVGGDDIEMGSVRDGASEDGAELLGDDKDDMDIDGVLDSADEGGDEAKDDIDDKTKHATSKGNLDEAIKGDLSLMFADDSDDGAEPPKAIGLVREGLSDSDSDNEQDDEAIPWDPSPVQRGEESVLGDPAAADSADERDRQIPLLDSDAEEDDDPDLVDEGMKSYRLYEATLGGAKGIRKVTKTSSRKGKPTNKGKGKAVGPNSMDNSAGLAEKKYDLQQIASEGGGGRIMFVFEKISGSEI